MKPEDSWRLSILRLSGRWEYPSEKLVTLAPNVHFELVGDTTTFIFDGELLANTITGQFREGQARGSFSIKRARTKPPTFKQEEVSFRNVDVTLSGTLMLPLTNGLLPAVVFLHGAGSEGRYGARFLAEYFTRYGIAALIYRVGPGLQFVRFLGDDLMILFNNPGT